jgi:hypothetical protein
MPQKLDFVTLDVFGEFISLPFGCGPYGMELSSLAHLLVAFFLSCFPFANRNVFLTRVVC